MPNYNDLHTNTRYFELKVHPSLSKFTATGNTGKRNKNMYYSNTGVEYQFSGNLNQQSVYRIMRAIEAEVNKTAMLVKRYWQTQVPRYFNRRSHGLYNGLPWLTSNYGKRVDRSTWQRYKNAPFTSAHQSSHQLENALEPTKIDVTGAQFYVVPCMSHDGRDYVEFLVEGRPEGGPPYHPADDKRYYDGTKREWGGIDHRYWSAWQAQFIRVIYQNENIMNESIHAILTKNAAIPPNTPKPYMPVISKPDEYIYGEFGDLPKDASYIGPAPWSKFSP